MATKKRLPGWHGFDTLLQDLALSPTVGLISAEPPLPMRLGRYNLTERIGRGGMGTVYRAHDPQLEREVAVKVVRTGFEPSRMARFAREVRALALLSHPNVIAMYDAGMEGDLAYFVMELLDGVTLRERLRTPVLVEDAYRIAGQIAQALSAAHARAIVHRDLKPENIVFGGDQLVKVLDFGLARFQQRTRDLKESHATGTGAVLGTVDYMSPEQARGQRATARSDVFSFGAVLYELVTGRKAFRAGSPVEVLTRILSDEPRELDRLTTSTLRGRLLAVARRCLEKDRKLRYASGAELVIALAESESEPITRNARMSRVRRARSKPVPFEQPITRYARAGDVHIAYQVVGQGPVDLCFISGFVSQVDVWWEVEPSRHFFQTLAEQVRLILFDKRGTGLSDRVPLPTLDQRVSDVTAVLDAVDSKQAVLFGEGGATAISWALRYPERTRGLILYGTAIDGEWKGKEAVRDLIAKGWGTGVSLPLFAPSLLLDPKLAAWGARWERLGASPGAVLTLLDSIENLDVRAEALQLRCPTLVVHRKGDRAVPVERGQELARTIPGARYVELEGEDHPPMIGDSASVLREISAFLSELKN